jgi:hypothetical protein
MVKNCGRSGELQKNCGKIERIAEIAENRVKIGTAIHHPLNGFKTGISYLNAHL